MKEGGDLLSKSLLKTEILGQRCSESQGLSDFSALFAVGNTHTAGSLRWSGKHSQGMCPHLLIWQPHQPHMRSHWAQGSNPQAAFTGPCPSTPPLSSCASGQGTKGHLPLVFHIHPFQPPRPTQVPIAFCVTKTHTRTRAHRHWLFAAFWHGRFPKGGGGRMPGIPCAHRFTNPRNVPKDHRRLPASPHVPHLLHEMASGIKQRHRRAKAAA
mmetsp:Transcript_80931/g.142730  ORF Transcript_80931/g.142730 Transcript_80931/m.142730 type:complete len:212 (-) Transcript_80931:836-1471(-)